MIPTAALAILRGVDNRDLDELPRVYRIGLRLDGLGADDDDLRGVPGIDPTVVPTHLEIGWQKMAGEP